MPSPPSADPVNIDILSVSRYGEDMGQEVTVCIHKCFSLNGIMLDTLIFITCDSLHRAQAELWKF